MSSCYGQARSQEQEHCTVTTRVTAQGQKLALQRHPDYWLSLYWARRKWSFFLTYCWFLNSCLVRQDLESSLFFLSIGSYHMLQSGAQGWAACRRGAGNTIPATVRGVSSSSAAQQAGHEGGRLSIRPEQPVSRCHVPHQGWAHLSPALRNFKLPPRRSRPHLRLPCFGWWKRFISKPLKPEKLNCWHLRQWKPQIGKQL